MNRQATRVVVAALVVVAAMFSGVAFGSADVSAATKTCQGVAATAVLTTDNNEYALTPGNDVVVGSRAADRITAPTPEDVGGVDLICGNGGDDVIGIVAGEGSLVDGGSGRDTILVVAGADATGGSGNDKLLMGCGEGTIVDGGSGNDALTGTTGEIEIALDAFANSLGQFGAGEYPCLPPIPAPFNGELVLIANTFLPQLVSLDEDLAAPSIWVFEGATGRGGSGNDAILGFASTVLKGDSGSDVVLELDLGALPPYFSDGPPASIDCGSGRDTVIAFGDIPTRRCELTPVN